MEWAVICGVCDWLIWTQDWVWRYRNLFITIITITITKAKPFGLSLWSQQKTDPKSETTQYLTSKLINKIAAYSKPKSNPHLSHLTAVTQRGEFNSMISEMRAHYYESFTTTAITGLPWL